MTNSTLIIEIDITGASADGVMHVTAISPSEIATTMFELERVLVRNPAEVMRATRITRSEVGRDLLLHELSREIRKMIKQERDRSSPGYH
jgi:hypothetical protein